MHEPDRIVLLVKIACFFFRFPTPPFVSADVAPIADIFAPNGAAPGLFSSLSRVKYCIFGCCLQRGDRVCPFSPLFQNISAKDEEEEEQ